jgi:hypothetical protein
MASLSPKSLPRCHLNLSTLVLNVASRPRFGGDSQAFSWYRPAGKVQLGRDQLERLSWVGTSWRGSAGQGPAGPKGFSYVYKYQGVTQVDSRQ